MTEPQDDEQQKQDQLVGTQSLALIGRFLLVWSNLEISIHLAIQAATKMDFFMLQIVCTNMTFRGKVDALRTIIDTSDLKSPQKEEFKSTLRRLGEYSKTRNLIAHSAFGYMVSEPGIAYHPIKAAGTFNAPMLSWFEEDFEREYGVMKEYDRELSKLRDLLKTAKFPHTPSWIGEMSREQRQQFAKDLENHLARQRRETPDSGQANPDKAGKK